MNASQVDFDITFVYRNIECKMSDVFRGEEIGLYQIYFQAESTYSCVAQLGELGIVQFRDV